MMSNEIEKASYRQLTDRMRSCGWVIEECQKKLDAAHAELALIMERLKSEAPILIEPVSALGLSPRIEKILIERHYDMVYKVAGIAPWTLPQGIGKTSWKQIEDRLRELKVPSMYR